VELTFADRVFFCNSGAEANEAAIKMARRAAGGRYKIVSAHGSFHGRTYGALAATGQPSLQEGFGPMLEGFVHVEPCSADAVAEAVGDDTAAVIVEPIIGEGGIVVPPDGYLAALREICDRSGARLILDEVQTGNGRTGRLFAYEHEGIVPDIITTAKGLGGGLPIGALLAREDVAAAFVPGSHGTTFGANPVCCAAALAVLGELTDGGLIANAARVGAYFLAKLREALGSREDVVDIRGKGLMIGVEFRKDTKPLVRELLARGVVANSTAGTVLRLIPPLVLTEAEVDEGVAAIAAAATEVMG
jgi:acetylornithine/succinyldiaminopimelate/putrescine aminotransferase